MNLKGIEHWLHWLPFSSRIIQFKLYTFRHPTRHCPAVPHTRQTAARQRANALSPSLPTHTYPEPALANWAHCAVTSAFSTNSLRCCCCCKPTAIATMTVDSDQAHAATSWSVEPGCAWLTKRLDHWATCVERPNERTLGRVTRAPAAASEDRRRADNAGRAEAGWRSSGGAATPLLTS